MLNGKLVVIIVLLNFTPLVMASGISGITFPIKADLIKNWFSDSSLDKRSGITLYGDSSLCNYICKDILKVNVRNIEKICETDYSYKNFVFRTFHHEMEIFLPKVIPVEDYYRIKCGINARNLLVESLWKEEEGEEGRKTRQIELKVADIAGQSVSLRISGNININGKLQNQSRSQVRTGIREGRSTTFIIDQKQQLNIEGRIGDRINLLVDQDSEREFDFENNLRILYTGNEDEIVQKIEAGNVTLSLPATQFATYSAKNSGLFGFKTLMKIGGLDITTIASVERSKKNALSAAGGETETTYEIYDYEYRKNLYFFLDETFRANFYPLIDGKFKYRNEVVDVIEVYKSVNVEEPGVVYGVAYVDPNDPSKYPNLAEKRLFIRLEPDKDYEVNRDLGFIKFSTSLREDEVVGVAYRVIDPISGNTVREYGDWDRDLADTTQITLKLLKPKNMLPSHPCWNLEFKNVYYLGSTNIKKEGFELKIVYTRGSTKKDEVADDGQSFLQKFGLDVRDQNGNPTPDDIPDLDIGAIFNLQTGELWFPYLRPFQYGSQDESGEKNPNLSEKYSCSAMYDSSRTDYNDIYSDSKFKIIVKYKNRSSVINLEPMIIEGSEEITLNGSQLRRGVDYTLDYFSGTLTLLNEAALDPNADLRISYETNELFQVDKKTILGARAQYSINERSFIGATLLYYSKSVMENKVELGYEPMRNFLWDINGKYSTNLNFLNRALNMIPGLRLEQESSFDIEGEIAQIRSNPNTINNKRTGDYNGVGFIDDFEASKRTISPPIIRRYWSISSAPVGKTQNERGYLFWFNPFGGVPTQSIWPDKEVSYRNQSDITEVLVLGFVPDWAISVTDGLVPRESAWGGIIYPFPSSYYDQTKTKFLEIWIKGDHGRLHIDLGEISEDVNGNGVLDKEDKPDPGSGYKFGNGIVDPGEDVGLDGVPDEEEYIVTTSGDTLRYGDERLKRYGRDPEDPHGDNWKWKETSTDYRKINGTEGNYNKDVGGNFPDTEDMDNNLTLDNRNDYFTVSFYLDERGDKYVEGRTYYDNGRPTGWKLYRIPISEFTKIDPAGNISWDNIRMCRLWVDEFSRSDTIMIAKMEFVSNEWEELGVANGFDQPFTQNEEAFAIKVINTEDNPDIYKPPKGVEGEYDRVNQIRLKEQSLVLWFDGEEGLKPGQIAAARKDLREALSFINYKKLKLFVHGKDIKTADGLRFTKNDTTGLVFFIRFGEDIDYYEYRQPIFSDEQIFWDKRNSIVIDFNFITGLKTYIRESDFPGNDSEPQQFFLYRDEEGKIIRRVWKEVKGGKYTGREIIINREPTITKVKTLTVGLINTNGAKVYYNVRSGIEEIKIFRKNSVRNTLKGEVWIDELRLSDVRKEPAIAYRTSINFKLSDLGSMNIQLSRKDADYHTVERGPSQNANALNTNKDFRISTSLNLQKFFPRSWGLRLPVSASYNQNTAIPMYFIGKDILTGDSPPDSLISSRKSYGYTVRYSKTRSDNWFTKYTIDQITLSFSASFQDFSDIYTRFNRSKSYRGNFSYSIPFGRNNYVKLFSWAESIPIIGEKIKDLKLYYTPEKFSVNLSSGESISKKIRRDNGEIYNNYTFGLNRTFNFSYKIFDNLNFSINKSIASDMREFGNDKLKAIKELKPGKVNNISEGYDINFNPTIAFLRPNFSYSSNFAWSEPINSTTKSIDQISNQNRIMTSVSISLKRLLETFYKPEGSSSSGRTKRGRRRPSLPTPTVDKNKRGEKVKNIPILDHLYKILDKVKPISFSYSLSNSIANYGRYGRPDLSYRIGFKKDPGLPIIQEEIGANIDNIVNNFDLSASTGIDISRNIKLNFNYSQNSAITRTQLQTNKNLNRSFLPLGKDGSDGFPFPSWRLNISGLQKLPILNKYLTSLSLSHSFLGKSTKIIQNGRMINTIYVSNFQPLAGLTFNLKKGINGNFNLSKGKTISLRQGDTEITEKMNMVSTLSYRKRGGLNIPLPFLNDVQLDNDITFNFSFDYSYSVKKSKRKNGTRFTKQGENKSWRVSPKISYSFTNKVTGGIFFEYGESYDIYTGKRITRNGGFDINIAIRG